MQNKARRPALGARFKGDLAVSHPREEIFLAFGKQFKLRQDDGLAGDLCDKVSTSLADLNGVAEKITDALTAHNEAVKRLSTGKGNALSIGQRIRSMGVKTKKPMPSMLVDGVSLAPPSEDSDERVSLETDPDA